MSAGGLLIKVSLYRPRWLGAAEWPPSPWRLFQALVAGAGLGRGLHPPAEEGAALRWLEQLPHPLIAAPLSRRGQQIRQYLPNNDLDRVGGRPSRIGKTRKAVKLLEPRLLDPPPTFLFAWQFDIAPDDALQHGIASLAHRLYQLGRGEDMAFAQAEFLDVASLQQQLAAHQGQLFRPASTGAPLRRPVCGSSTGLLDRHARQPERWSGGLFRNLPPAPFARACYGSPADNLLYELRSTVNFYAWPLRATAKLAIAVRDALAAKLLHAGLDSNAVEHLIVGRGAGDQDKQRRIQIIPLPSIGSVHADMSVRRILVRRPGTCPITAADLTWALAGLDLGMEKSTGELPNESSPRLVQAEDRSMLDHYGAGGEANARHWQTVTPAALGWEGTHPTRAARESALARLVLQSLRHAGLTQQPAQVRVQREPFAQHGDRAESFVAHPRFPASQLWHCDIEFAEPIPGPLAIGNGRFLGLGLCAPEPPADAMLWSIAAVNRPPVAEAAALTHALRRALMHLAAGPQGNVPTLFSGHTDGSGPARSGDHRHVYLLALDRDGDGQLDTLAAIAPWRMDRTWRPKQSEQKQFSEAVASLRHLVAGRLGILSLASLPDSRDDLFSTANVWRSLTPYAPTRHARRAGDWPTLIARDLAVECQRRGLPLPETEILSITTGPRRGACAHLRLHFLAAISGPLALGRTAHSGGGWFAPAQS
ncbi:MAG: type I-G CRISPR-associated protein Csb2 [Terriglobales bacterium]